MKGKSSDLVFIRKTVLEVLLLFGEEKAVYPEE